MSRPPDAFGDPESLICRWCGCMKAYLRGFRLCTACDSPNPGGITTPGCWIEELS
jgi:hypothetical protein